MEIGKYHTFKVAKEVDFGVYLDTPAGEVLMPTKYIPEGLKVGDEIKVFIYRDSEDRLIATTLEPEAQLDEFAALEAKDVTDHGAFMEWGLEKDLFVPNKEQNKRMIKGKKYVIRVCLDHKTDRLVGTARLDAFIDKDTSELEEGQLVDLLIYRETDTGYMALIDQKFEGLIYKNEVFEPLEIGDKKTGFIKKVREDGKIDLTLNKAGINAIDSNKAQILTKLKENEGFLPYHDKSAAEDIIEVFSMSKKAFKKAIGGLYKDEVIDIKDEGIQLK